MISDNHIISKGKFFPKDKKFCDKKIYRVFQRKYFFDLFEERQNALVWPKLWDDPYENLILKSPVQVFGAGLATYDYEKDLYGQCWTLHEESDAMWRIYSPCKNAMCVQTTVGTLLDSLAAANKSKASISCFIGEVKYKTRCNLEKYLKPLFRNEDLSDAIPMSLLVKREAFEHENEVRLIYVENDPKKRTGKGVYKYSLDPYSVFDQVTVDPRMSDQEFRQAKAEIMTRTKLPEGMIRHSSLYKPPDNFISEL